VPWRNQSTIRIRRESASQGSPRAAANARPGISNIQNQRLRPSASAEPVERPRTGSVAGTRLKHETNLDVPEGRGGRRRSSSDPNRAWNETHDTAGALVPGSAFSPMPEVTEGVATETPAQSLEVPETTTGSRRRSRTGGNLLRFPSFRSSSAEKEKEKAAELDDSEQNQYNADLIDLLDTVGMLHPDSRNIEHI